MISIEPLRWALAAGAVAGYAALCFATLRRGRAAAVPAGEHDWLVAYASQTGSAEFLAERSAATLRAGGLHARAVSVDLLDAATVGGDARILFIASTYGEGDPPDSAARLMRYLAAGPRLNNLHYAVLALGDSSYAQFCGFGRQLDSTLKALGANSLFARIESDRGAPVALAAWQAQLGRLASLGDDIAWDAPAGTPWRILSRKRMNPGSAGAPVYQIMLAPAGEEPLQWEAGDLAEVCVPADPDYPRAYSIASTPSEGALALLVRLHMRDDGSHGLASSHLCLGAGEGAGESTSGAAGAANTVLLRIRPHQRFRIGDNATRPLILIGNGTGIAGLRGHLKARIDANCRRNWLIFGERNAAHDALYHMELKAWLEHGMIARLTQVYSRDGGALRYVQDAVDRQAEQIRAWVDDGAAIYVCGSLRGMAAGVHAALISALGEQRLTNLEETGRYRRDVY